MTERTFDGVSYSKQTSKECILFFLLREMKTTRGMMGKYKPTNTELPKPVITPETICVTAVVNVDGQPVTYKWEKGHRNRIAKCEIKPEEKQLKVTLTKAKQGDDWITEFLDDLQEV